MRASPNPAPRRRRRRAAATVITLVVVALAVVALVGYSRGFRIAFSRPAVDEGWPPLRFAAAGESERLVHEFPTGARPKNLILVVADGMGFNHLVATRARYAGVDGRLFIERFPFAGWITTHSLGNLYTDSGAAATSLATGVKTGLAMLSRTPDGGSPTTILEAGLARGMRAGMITTTVIFDATPAAFATHVDRRRDTDEVVRQMAASGVELLVSEGVVDDPPGLAEVAARAKERFIGAGYRWIESWADLAAEPGGPPGKVIALLPPGTLATPERTVPLVDVADLALERFGGSPEGFFLLVEDEDPDTGAHYADLERVTFAIHALDEVAQRAVEFARGDGETLVLVAADHETGGLKIVGGRDGYRPVMFWTSTTHTGEPVPLFAYGPGAERFTGALDNTDVPRILADLLGLELS